MRSQMLHESVNSDEIKKQWHQKLIGKDGRLEFYKFDNFIIKHLLYLI